MATSEISLDSIFSEALEIESTQQREAYLDQACRDDDKLRQQVQRLLDAHFRVGNFLGGPAVGDTMDVAPIVERPGMTVGRYKLLQQIGEGGFGVVFMAEQQAPVTRKVALKVIKPGMDTREVIARFEAERQALALMDHPHIAAIYDGGATESGRPYFVMELVHGIPITDYCEQGELAPRERIELFKTVCQAVQHAHQKGIIHRDLKPSNILVTLHDGEPVVKVIDFGIAKATNQRLTDRTLFTRFGGMVGTPLYMSPEQAELSGLDVDIRTDVYALGVLLYELLTGTTPFEKDRLQKAAFDEVRRIIREEDPPRPSVRLSTLASQSRGLKGPGKQSKPSRPNVSGDLDWIVMKAIEKDRNRRYTTSKEFEMDLQRYLEEKPVVARPPSMVYSTKKFVRRHRVRIAFGCLVASLLLACGLWINGVYTARTEAEFTHKVTEFRIALAGGNSAGNLSEAERAFDSLCRSPLHRHPAVAAGGIQLAATLAKSGQLDKSRRILDRVHSDWTINQLKTLPDADTKQLARLLEKSALDLAIDLNFPKDKLESALELAFYASELGADVDGLLAWIEANLGHTKEARIALDNSLQRHSDSLWDWGIEARILAASGKKELARDWYLASRESMASIDQIRSRRFGESNGAWARTQGWDPAWPPAGWKEADTQALIERILSQRPRSSHAYSRLGACYARQGRWQEARGAYQKSVDLVPDGPIGSYDLYNRLSLAGALLQAGDTTAYQRLCRETVQPAMTKEFGIFMGRDVAVLCCAGEDSGVSFRDVRQVVEEAARRDGENWNNVTLVWVRGMLDYRSGNWDQAIDNLRGMEGASELRIVAPFFLAMAFHKSGDKEAARKRLREAELQAAKIVPSFDGPPTDWYETTMIWSVLQPIRREAHALIDEPAAGETKDATGKPNGDEAKY